MLTEIRVRVVRNRNALTDGQGRLCRPVALPRGESPEVRLPDGYWDYYSYPLAPPPLYRIAIQAGRD